MIWWILVMAVLGILSYLSAVGTLFIMQIKFPFLTSSFINILILVCMAIVLVRILRRMKRGEKEILSKRIHELETELKDKLVIGRVDVDSNQELASQYGVMSIPTLKLFHKGKVTSEMVGVQSKDKLIDEVNKISQ